MRTFPRGTDKLEPIPRPVKTLRVKNIQKLISGREILWNVKDHGLGLFNPRHAIEKYSKQTSRVFELGVIFQIRL